MADDTFLRAQCFVKKPIEPLFNEKNQPKLLYVSEVRPNQSIHPRIMHSHKNHTEVVLIIEGESTYLIDNRTFPVKAGDILIYNPGVIHDEISGPNNKLGSYCLAIGELRMPGLPDNFLIPDDIGFIFPSGKYFDQLHQLASMMFKSLSAEESHAEIFANSLMHAFLIKVFLVIKEYTKDENLLKQKSSPDLSNVETLGRSIKNYIDEHYMEPITLQSISNALYISPYYLSHVFKSMSGYSPLQYTLRRRIGEAQSLLISTNLSLSEIVDRVGFDSQSYFNYQFTKNVGVSPKKYRDNYVVK